MIPDLHPEEQSIEQLMIQQAAGTAPVISSKTPLQTIGLAFSGGGFRAASFSLGALSYLARIVYKGKPLLKNVQFITSTSGGSITNGAYSVYLYTNPSPDFADFYKQLRENIDGEKLLNEVFRILNNEEEWNEDGTMTDENGKTISIKKQKNLINAFAKSYDNKLYKGATLGTFANKAGMQTEKPHLREICFNCTEFNNGLNFYFKVNGDKGYIRKYGNSYLQINDTPAARQLKISDIVAASSCFPGGFEPIVFPTDFIHPGITDADALIKTIHYNHNKPSQLSKVKNKPFSLMDGGITDNMGLNAILVEDNMRARYKQDTFDLILACDVTSYFINPVKETVIPKSWFIRNITLSNIRNLLFIFNIIFVLCLAALITGFWSSAGLLLLIPSFVFAFLYWKWRAAAKPPASGDIGIGGTLLKNISFFETLPLASVINMLCARLNSVALMVGDLFLKQIRRDQYNYMFSMPSLRARAIACLVYEFSTANAERRKENLEIRDKDWWEGSGDLYMPSAALISYSDQATAMGTTLWFSGDDKKKKDQLIVTGQATACYSLIKHIQRTRVSNPSLSDDPELNKLFVALMQDWKTFKERPDFMLEDINAGFE